MEQDVSGLMEEYARQPGAAAKAIRELCDGNDAQCLEAIESIVNLPDSPARDRLMRLLMADECALARFTDPGFLPLAEAVSLAGRMQLLDSTVDVRLLRLLLPQSDHVIRDPWHASRVLEIVAAVSDGRRLQALLSALLRHPEVRVRSKVALMRGRFSRNVHWLEQFLAERDPRVRANAIESMWGLASRHARELFLLAAKDRNPRVVANAVVGLHRAGELNSTRLVRRMACAEDLGFRASALWAMGETRDPRFLPVLSEIVARREPGIVHQNAIRSTIRIRGRLAELRQNEPLRVGAAWRVDRLEVWVRSADGLPLVSLPPTAFVVHDRTGPHDIRSVRYVAEHDGSAVDRYELALGGSLQPELRVSVYTDCWMGEQDAR